MSAWVEAIELRTAPNQFQHTLNVPKKNREMNRRISLRRQINIRMGIKMSPQFVELSSARGGRNKRFHHGCSVIDPFDDWTLVRMFHIKLDLNRMSVLQIGEASFADSVVPLPASVVHDPFNRSFVQVIWNGVIRDNPKPPALSVEFQTYIAAGDSLIRQVSVEVIGATEFTG